QQGADGQIDPRGQYDQRHPYRHNGVNGGLLQNIEQVIDGKKVVTRSPQDGLANGIVYISEDRKRDGLVLGMSVKENMSLTALR
ncbi:hypothetical protein, partial [Klebsiella pneumoniae]|uniref:hypothetical protein n=1 Tax=Klebsiella pneumoniae TaxID=573 RepID=UPI001E381B27